MINSYIYEPYNVVWCKVVNREICNDKVLSDQDLINECIEKIHLLKESSIFYPGNLELTARFLGCVLRNFRLVGMRF